jgi:hypothetical protein
MWPLQAFALTNEAQVSLALVCALDAIGILAALWVARTGRLAPTRARAQITLGMLVAGLSLAFVALAPLVAADLRLADAADWPTAQWQWAGAVLGLLLVGSGAERLAFMLPARRRGARLVEACALAVVLVGTSGAVAATVGLLPTDKLAGVPLSLVAEIGWAVALGGAAAVVAANASGRLSGPVPYRRRVWLSLSALLFAGTAATSPLLARWFGALVSSHQAGLALGSALECTGLVILALGARRVLDRPHATQYWRSSLGVGQRADHPHHGAAQRGATSKPTRIVPSLPHTPSIASVPVVATSLALSPSAPAPAAPFTPPVLRQGVLPPEAAIRTPRASALAEAADEPATTPWASPPTPVSAAVIPTGQATVAAAPPQTDLAPADPTNRLTGVMEATNLAPRRPLSPQFVAALVRLQTEMAYAGRTYEFEELVNLFSDVRPRATNPLLAGSAGLDRPEGLTPLPVAQPPVAPPPPSQATRVSPPDESSADRQRLRPHILL